MVYQILHSCETTEGHLRVVSDALDGSRVQLNMLLVRAGGVVSRQERQFIQNVSMVAQVHESLGCGVAAAVDVEGVFFVGFMIEVEGHLRRLFHGGKLNKI